jgi:hypothetical protein
LSLRSLALLGVLTGILGGLSPCRATPPAFPIKQLVFQTDEYITTPYQRPGDGTRRRLPAGWKGLSQTRQTFPEDRIPAIRRKRTLDHVYFPVKNGRILRINNRSEFCAWALDYRILDVDFMDLGFHAGKDDCPRDYDFYQRTQHPANDESLYVRGRAGEAAPDPFAGRPQDAMYGDAFLLSTRMEQRRADDKARLYWNPIGVGDTVTGLGLVKMYLTLTPEDILPLKLLDVWLVAEQTDRDHQEPPVEVDTLDTTPPLDFPVILSPGESATYLFQESIPMRDIQARNMRLHFMVEFEDPWGRTVRKVHRTHYWKAAW